MSTHTVTKAQLQELVDYALDRGVSVNASTWLDNDGAIEESVYLVSSMQLESLRFNEFANDFGYPEPAIVQVPQGAAEHVVICTENKTPHGLKTDGPHGLKTDGPHQPTTPHFLWSARP